MLHTKIKGKPSAARAFAKLQATCLMLAIILISVAYYSPAPEPAAVVAEAKDERGKIEKVVDWGAKWGKKIAPIVAFF